jgi:hypothetical protein
VAAVVAKSEWRLAAANVDHRRNGSMAIWRNVWRKCVSVMAWRKLWRKWRNMAYHQRKRIENVMAKIDKRNGMQKMSAAEENNGVA